MAVRPLVILPDPLLKRVSEPVKTIGSEERRLIADMFETMYKAPGIGLAAVQIGALQRVVVIDIAKEDQPKAPLVFVNPEIVWSSEETSEYEEGCLSIPEFYEMVTRPSKVRVRHLDEHGVEHERECEGLLATCIQHEIDHLNGVLFIDHISRLKRERVIRKFTKAAKQTKEPA
ncbi:MAG: peptide deformylase [Hyphomicrobiales bacterium]